MSFAMLNWPFRMIPGWISRMDGFGGRHGESVFVIPYIIAAPAAGTSIPKKFSQKDVSELPPTGINCFGCRSWFLTSAGSEDFCTATEALGGVAFASNFAARG